MSELQEAIEQALREYVRHGGGREQYATTARIAVEVVAQHPALQELRDAMAKYDGTSRHSALLYEYRADLFAAARRLLEAFLSPDQ